jgi:hypothetical protein
LFLYLDPHRLSDAFWETNHTFKCLDFRKLQKHFIENQYFENIVELLWWMTVNSMTNTHSYISTHFISYDPPFSRENNNAWWSANLTVNPRLTEKLVISNSQKLKLTSFISHQKSSRLVYPHQVYVIAYLHIIFKRLFLFRKIHQKQFVEQISVLFQHGVH